MLNTACNVNQLIVPKMSIYSLMKAITTAIDNSKKTHASTVLIVPQRESLMPVKKLLDNPALTLLCTWPEGGFLFFKE